MSDSIREIGSIILLSLAGILVLFLVIYLWLGAKIVKMFNTIKKTINSKEFRKFLLYLTVLIIICFVVGSILENRESIWSWILGILIVIRYIIKRPLIVGLGLTMLYFLIKFIRRAWYHGE